MRGSDTLSFQMSRLNGTNQNIYTSHPTLSINQPFAAPCHFHRFRKAAESDSFPPGEAKNRNRTLVPFTEPRCSHNVRADSIRPYRHSG